MLIPLLRYWICRLISCQMSPVRPLILDPHPRVGRAQQEFQDILSECREISRLVIAMLAQLGSEDWQDVDLIERRPLGDQFGKTV